MIELGAAEVSIMCLKGYGIFLIFFVPFFIYTGMRMKTIKDLERFYLLVAIGIIFPMLAFGPTLFAINILFPN